MNGVNISLTEFAQKTFEHEQIPRITRDRRKIFKTRDGAQRNNFFLHEGRQGLVGFGNVEVYNYPYDLTKRVNDSFSAELRFTVENNVVKAITLMTVE